MKSIFPIMLVLLVAPPAFGQAFTDHAAIDAAITGFTGVPTGSPGGAIQPVDRRLRLARCRQSLAIGWHRPAGSPRRDTLVVRCPDAEGWRLFVPVGQQAAGSAPNPPLVVRGDALTITVAGPGFAVSQPGEALESGGAGAWIKVRSAMRSDPMRAKVIRPGLVSLPLP